MDVVKGIAAAALVSLGALGAGALALVVGGFVLIGFSCWVAWEPLTREICVDTVEDIERHFDRSESEGDAIEEARELTEALHRECRAGRASYWTVAQVEIDTRRDTRDRRWSRADQERFARRMRREFGIGD